MIIYQRWLESCLQTGIPAISTDTAARLMAVLLENGNNEAMTHDVKFLADVGYIQKRFHLHEMGIVDGEFQRLLRHYIKELQDYYESHKEERFSYKGGVKAVVPEWAIRLFQERYKMTLI